MDSAAALLILPIAAAALLLLRSAWEKKQLCTEHYTFHTAKLPKGEHIRLVFLSDLHSVSFGQGNVRLLEAIECLKPDAVLIGGDMITCGKTTQRAPQTGVCTHLMEQLCLRYPVYYAEGNHEQRFEKRFPLEYSLFRQHLCQTAGLHDISTKPEKIQPLKRTAAKRQGQEKAIAVLAAPLDAAYYGKLKPGFGRKKELPKDALLRLLGRPQKDRFQVLLLHSPMYLKEAAAWGADLVLSGHFHGGTIRLPFLGGLMTPQYQFFVKECAGLHRIGEQAMIANRGLGTHSIRIRIHNLPEISCIDIEGTQEGT